MSELLDERHRLAQKRLDENVFARLYALLAGLSEPREQAAMDVYNTGAAAIVGGGQRASVQLAFAYVGALLRFKRQPSLDRALAPVLVSRESSVTRSPILRAWSMIDEGLPQSEAISSAQSYARRLASNELQVAERNGLDEGAHAAERKIRGWRKQLAASPCPWCVRVGGQRVYRSAETVPFHENDECGVAPVFEREEGT